MRKKTKFGMAVGLVCVTALLCAILIMAQPILCVRFHSEPDSNSLALLPLTPSDEAELRHQVDNARRDVHLRGRLLVDMRSRYKNNGTDIPQVAPGLYCKRCKKGSALVFSIDEEGYGYFAFVNISGAMKIELDTEQNGIYLLPILPPLKK